MVSCHCNGNAGTPENQYLQHQPRLNFSACSSQQCTHNTAEKTVAKKKSNDNKIPQLFEDLNEIKLIYSRLHSSANKYNLVQKRTLTRKLKDFFTVKSEGKNFVVGCNTPAPAKEEDLVRLVTSWCYSNNHSSFF